MKVQCAMAKIERRYMQIYKCLVLLNLITLLAQRHKNFVVSLLNRSTRKVEFPKRAPGWRQQNIPYQSSLAPDLTILSVNKIDQYKNIYVNPRSSQRFQDTLYSGLSRLRRSSMPKAYIIKGDID